MEPRETKTHSLLHALAGPAVLLALIVIVLGCLFFSGGKLIPVASRLGYPDVFSGIPLLRLLTMEAVDTFLSGIRISMRASLFSRRCRPICFIPSAGFISSSAPSPRSISSWRFILPSPPSAPMPHALRRRDSPPAPPSPVPPMHSQAPSIWVTAGHLSPWPRSAGSPYSFLCIDSVAMERRFLSGILLGSIAICLQLLGGYPQCCYYAAIVAGAYLLLESIGKPRPLAIYAAFTAMYALGGMLAAVQLLPAMKVTALSIRAGGITYQFSKTFALAPENLLSLFLPYPLGDIKHIPYVGPWYLWEQSIYAGLLVFCLACIGIVLRPRHHRWRIILLLLVVIVLMLGPATPAHHLLYRFFPGFHFFRGASKFATLWTLLIAILSGEGFDQLLSKTPGKWGTRCALAAGMVFLVCGMVLAFDPSATLLTHLVYSTGQPEQLIALDRLYAKLNLIVTLNWWIAVEACVAAGLLGILFALLTWRRYTTRAIYCLALLAMADVYLAAAFGTMHSASTLPYSPQWNLAIADSIVNNKRVFFTNSEEYGDGGNLYGYNSLWSYDPGQPKRYTKLIQTSQGVEDMPADQYTEALYQQKSPIPVSVALCICAVHRSRECRQEVA